MASPADPLPTPFSSAAHLCSSSNTRCCHGTPRCSAVCLMRLRAPSFSTPGTMAAETLERGTWDTGAPDAVRDTRRTQGAVCTGGGRRALFVFRTKKRGLYQNVDQARQEVVPCGSIQWNLLASGSVSSRGKARGGPHRVRRRCARTCPLGLGCAALRCGLRPKLHLLTAAAGTASPHLGGCAAWMCCCDLHGDCWGGWDGLGTQ